MSSFRENTSGLLDSMEVFSGRVVIAWILAVFPIHLLALFKESPTLSAWLGFEWRQTVLGAIPAGIVMISLAIISRLPTSSVPDKYRKWLSVALESNCLALFVSTCWLVLVLYWIPLNLPVHIPSANWQWAAKTIVFTFPMVWVLTVITHAAIVYVSRRAFLLSRLTCGLLCLGAATLAFAARMIFWGWTPQTAKLALSIVSFVGVLSCTSLLLKIGTRIKVFLVILAVVFLCGLSLIPLRMAAPGNDVRRLLAKEPSVVAWITLVVADNVVPQHGYSDSIAVVFKNTNALSLGIENEIDHKTSEQPDVLLVTIDSLSAFHVGVYGYPLKITPNIDELAKTGTVYRRAYSTSGDTREVMPSLHSSSNCEISSNGSLAPPTVFGVLKDAGYYTIAVVVVGLFEKGTGYYGDNVSRGFTEWIEIGDRTTRNVVRLDGDITAKALTRLSNKSKEKSPVALWVHYYDPHSAYVPGPLPNGDNKPRLSNYDMEVSGTDESLGLLLAGWRLQRKGKKSIVAVMADHGEADGSDGRYGHGNGLERSNTWIPLVIVGAPFRATYDDRLANTLDLGPTLLDALGLPSPKAFRGVSLLDASSRRKYVCSQMHPTGPQREAILGIRDLKGSLYCHWQSKLEILYDASYTELYNSNTDPFERINLADSQHARKRQLLDMAAMCGCGSAKVAERCKQ